MVSDHSSGYEQRQRLLAVILVAVLLGSTIPVLTADATTTATAGTTSTPDDPNTFRFAYYDKSDGHIAMVYGNSTEVSLNNTSGARVIGAARDLDADREIEVPFVTSQTELFVIDKNGEKQHLASNALKDKTKLGTGDWDDDGRSAVFFVKTDNKVYYKEVGGNSTLLGDGITAESAFGVTDLTNDGVEEVIYTDGNNLYYYNRTGTVKFYDGGVGDNNGLGVGAPADFDGDGTPRVPIVDTSQNVLLVNAGNDTQQLAMSDKAPIAAVNWTGGSTLEAVHSTDSDVKYATLNGTTGDIAVSSALQTAGIARVVEDESLNVSNFTLTNTSDNLTVAFETNDPLDRVTVELTGPENATFHRANFSESGSGDGPFTYSKTYNASTAGEYDATLTTATDQDGDVFDRNLHDTAVVTLGGGVVTNATLADVTDHNGAVNESDRIRIVGNVTGDVEVVTANASAYGNESVTLSHVSGDTYAAVIPVDASNVSATNEPVSVTSHDGEGNTDTETSNTLILDTVAPRLELGPDHYASVGETITFSPDTVDEGSWTIRYAWVFGTGDGTTGETVTYSYDAAGDYTARLAVTDAAGNVGFDTVGVHIEAQTSGDTDTSDTTASTNEATNDDQQQTTTTTSTPTTTKTTTATTTATTTTVTTTVTTSTTETTATTTDTATTMTTNTSEQQQASSVGSTGPAEGLLWGFLIVVLVGLGARLAQHRP